MNAYVLHDISKFNMEEVPVPVPEEGEVLVEVKASGICGSDIPRIFVNGTYNYPLIPGHEFSGEVVDTFEGDDPEEAQKLVGKRVGIFPLIPCMECPQCKERRFEMCKSYSYLGSRRDGGFAEFVAVPKKNLILLPDNVSYEAAAMLEPMAVAVHAIRRIKPKKDETVAVCGLGTIGMLVVMFLLEMGIQDVIVFANKESQRKMAVELGVDSKNLGLKNKPIDVFFECVGSNETIKWGLSLTKPGGRVMLVGNPKGDVELDRDIYWKILRNQLTLMGTWNSSFMIDGFKSLTDEDDWQYVIRRLSEGRINPEKLITHKYPLDALLQGFYLMRDKSEEYIKVMGVK
ncbi:MAG: galactitol-1-phosphate 5-dehydrogenase [Lachnospiraceae bacterium]|nr:galactitol-1-phosphate 5-dehydrogenase [Lachnospiraceae bacterium]